LASATASALEHKLHNTTAVHAYTLPSPLPSYHPLQQVTWFWRSSVPALLRLHSVLQQLANQQYKINCSSIEDPFTLPEGAVRSEAVRCGRARVVRSLNVQSLGLGLVEDP